MSGPEGKNYCSSHMSQAVLPHPEPAKVKFEDADAPKAPDKHGMGNIPDGALRALVQKLEVADGLTEPEIPHKFPADYGGSY